MNCSEEEGFRLGSFYPERKLEKGVMEIWTNRDILNLKSCQECPLALLCGGGCSRLVAQMRADMRNDVVCPPMVGLKDLQVLFDYYGPILLDRFKANE